MKDNIAIIINSLLYILNKIDSRTTDTHQLFKILYFAERKHLSLYGKPITDDSYVAMKFGPVPSLAFNIVNCCKGDEFLDDSIIEASKLISAEGYSVTASSETDLDWLSKSEIKCLDESFSENIDLSFTQLTNKSHDSAWDKAIHYMEKLEIAKAGGADESLLSYISSKDEIKNLSF
jgi:uncharacterized phage-associated protein